MATNIDVDVKLNIKEFQNASERMINLALKTIGQDAENNAKAGCPVDTGRLRGSITNQVLEDEKAVIIGTDVEYGKYVELGEHAKHKVGGAHFLRNAIADHIDQYQNILEQYLKNG